MKMPSTYAHKKFGALVYKELPQDVKELVKDNLDEYLAGLHGPDILFFYRPGQASELNKLGSDMHRVDFSITFQRAIGELKKNYSDESLVYWLGMLTHYFLDSAAHPMVGKAVEDLGMSHGKIEVELDRALLIREGKNPVGYKVGKHLPVYPDVAEAASIFYPHVTHGQILEALAEMKGVSLLCSSDKDIIRTNICKIMNKTGNTEKIASLIMSKDASEKAKRYTKKLIQILEAEVSPCATALTCFARNYDDFTIGERYNQDFLGKKKKED